MDDGHYARAGLIRKGGKRLRLLGGSLTLSCLDVRRDDLIRIINFTSLGHNRYKYEESTELMTSEGPSTYQDSFELRYWNQDEVRAALSAAGLAVTEDRSAHFPMAGAEYWLCRRV